MLQGSWNHRQTQTGSQSEMSNIVYATYPLSDIIGGNLPNYMQLPLDPQKALYYLLHMRFSVDPL